MDYKILGPLEVSYGDRPLVLGGEKQRALLAMLLLHAGEVVSADRLIDELWGERAPPGVANALQVHVSRLRKVLDHNGRGPPEANGGPSAPSPGGVLVTRGHGYMLRVEPGELDLDRFLEVVEVGRRALASGDAQQAAGALRAGLELWRGPPLADFAYEAFAQAPIAQLEELRLGAVEDRVEADLALGRHQQLIGELAALVKQNPLRERLRTQLMLALYRCGRQAEALDAYQEYRRGLAEELGLDPSPRLQQLQAAVLARDPSLEPQASGGTRLERPGGEWLSPNARAGAAQEGVGLDGAGVGTDPGAPLVGGRAAGFRTFLLANIRGYSSFASMRGDEAAAALTDRFVALAQGVATQFGGVSVGNRGDEVLVAFESPRQAIRAAVAFQQALLEATRTDSTLPVPAGLGLDVGEAVIVADGWRANAINVAARLCSIAEGGEIMATREVAHLAQAIDGIRYLPQPPARLKGVHEPVAAVRIVADAGDTARGFAQLGLTHAAAAPVYRRKGRGRAIVAAALLAAAAAIAGVLALRGGQTSLSAVAANSVGAISQSSGAITGDAPVGLSPSGVAAGANAVWVANYSAGTVSQIDPTTHAVKQTSQAGLTPTGIAVGPGAVWVTNGYSDTVARIDPADVSAQPVFTRVGNGPSGIAVGDGSVWVANSGDATLSQIDATTGSVVGRPIELGGNPTGVVVGFQAVWVSDVTNGRVLRFDPHTRHVTSIPDDGGPSAITIAFHSVWVTNGLAGTITRINPQTNHVIATEQVGRTPDAIAAGARAVWVANELDGTVVRVNPATNMVTQTVAVGNSPHGLAVAGGLVWVTAEASHTRVLTSGPGLTEPTQPSGPKISGGTVYFTEQPGPTGVPFPATPNYIFPMYSSHYCTATAVQLIPMLYRPLYWFGNNYRPTVDYRYSIGRRPSFSGGDRTVTIKLNSWKWSDGERVSSRDLMFWMNVLKANPAGWCASVPGYFPDLVTGYWAPDPQTFVMRFNQAYDPRWVQYNVLSQLTPLPLAWDRTSLSQPAPRSDNGHLPDATPSGATAVYKFLDGESTKLGSWDRSPLWKVVDGPFKLQSFTSGGEVTLIANRYYSGSPKPTISKLVELPFTSDAASLRALESGPNKITVANVPAEYAGAIPALIAEGYELNKAATYSFFFFSLNFHSSAKTSPGGEPVRYIFSQAYFRQAFQHLVDQQGWITAFFSGSANPTCGPIPLSPPSPLLNATKLSTRSCDFSVATAGQLLRANGWKVVQGGTTRCVKPGTAAGECGTGIKAGEGISFNVDYQPGVASIQYEMKDLAAQAKRVGINLSLTQPNIGQPPPGACTPNQKTCEWTASWGPGWTYGPDYLPTGELLYAPGGLANAGSYKDPKINRLIQATVTGPRAGENTALTQYDKYTQQQLPTLFGPTQIGSYLPDAGTLVAKNLGGYAANAFGAMNPEDWYLTR